MIVADAKIVSRDHCEIVREARMTHPEIISRQALCSRERPQEWRRSKKRVVKITILENDNIDVVQLARSGPYFVLSPRIRRKYRRQKRACCPSNEALHSRPW